jgi:BlaI family transcriptional regulator, penicillinase repressor
LLHQASNVLEDSLVPPRQSGTLTEAELRIMNVLWVRGSGTVQEVLDSITQRPVLAYNSVLTTIRVLEKKGYLKHLKDGRAHVYTPLVGQKEATRSEIRHLVNRFFKNSHEQLVLNLLEDQGIEEDEIGRLREMLASKDRGLGLKETALNKTDLKDTSLSENDRSASK